MLSGRIEKALDQMAKARQLFKMAIEGIRGDEWLSKPNGVTNLAWQTGHVAAAQYMLCLGRMRGARDEDEQLVPTDVRKWYGRGSTPSEDPAENSTPKELLAMLDRVDAAVRIELPTISEEVLSQDVNPPHPMFKLRIEAVEFCALHEMMHVGQATLLRRQLGREPRF